MKPKTVIMFGVAIVCGLAASFGASYVIGQNQAQVKVLVAKEKMRQYEVIRQKELDDKFEEKSILQSQAPKDVCLAEKKAELIGRQLKKNVDENSILTLDDLAKDKSSLEAMLKNGERAWGVRVDAETMAGGFVLPGSKVDVWHITRIGNRDADAKVVLQDVLVVGVGQQSERPQDRGSMVESTVTLALNADQISELAKAQDGGTGKIRLSLRAAGDDTKTELTSKDPADQLAKNDPPPPPPPPVADAPTPPTPGTEPNKPVEQEFETKTMTVYNSGGWVLREYKLDKKSKQVVSSRIVESVAAPKTALDLKPEPKDSDKPKDTTKETN